MQQKSLKNRLVLLILFIIPITNFLSIYRFYAGRVLLGIVRIILFIAFVVTEHNENIMALSLFAWMIITVIDFILILFGKFKDKNKLPISSFNPKKDYENFLAEEGTEEESKMKTEEPVNKILEQKNTEEKEYLKEEPKESMKEEEEEEEEDDEDDDDDTVKEAFSRSMSYGGFNIMGDFKKNSKGKYIGIPTEERRERKRLLKGFRPKVQQLISLYAEKLTEAYKFDISLFASAYLCKSNNEADKFLEGLISELPNFAKEFDDLLYIINPIPKITEETLEELYDSLYKVFEDELNNLKKVYPQEVAVALTIPKGKLPSEDDKRDDAIKEIEKRMNTKVVTEPQPVTTIKKKRDIMLSIISSACRSKPYFATVTEDNINEPYVQYFNGPHTNNREDIEPDELYIGNSCGKEKIDEYNKPMILGSMFVWAALDKNNSVTFYSYDDIPKSKRPNLLRFDKNFNFDEFVAIYDITSNCTNGFVFMLSGLYIPSSGILSGKFISYSDISGIDTSGHFEGEIKAKDGTIFKFPLRNFSEGSIGSLISELMRVDSSYWTHRNKTGKKDRLYVDHDSYFAGEKEGYVRASAEYEKKLRDQAEKFLRAKDEWKNCRDEYESLLDECAKTIDELNEIISKNAKNEYINRRDSVQYVYDSLKGLRLE